jgi:hypothetical protein
MLTLEQLAERLESLYVAVGTMYKNQSDIADEWYNHKIEVKEAEALLQSTRASAVAAKAIQQEIQLKEHGANANLRDAHERNYLKFQHLDLENAQLREQQARHDFDQVQREISGVQKQISLAQSQVQIHKLLTLNAGVRIYQPEE